MDRSPRKWSASKQESMGWCHPVVSAEHLSVGRVALNSKYSLHASQLQGLTTQAKLHGLLQSATGLQLVVSRCNSSRWS